MYNHNQYESLVTALQDWLRIYEYISTAKLFCTSVLVICPLYFCIYNLCCCSGQLPHTALNKGLFYSIQFYSMSAGCLFTRPSHRGEPTSFISMHACEAAAPSPLLFTHSELQAEEHSVAPHTGYIIHTHIHTPTHPGISCTRFT